MKEYTIAIVLVLLLAGGGIAWAKYGKFLRSYPNYTAMLDGVYEDSVPLIYANDLAQYPKFHLLDTREPNEYGASHIPTAVYMGYTHINWAALKNIGKNEMIVVYCSVGYRSERVGDQLIAKGYTKVYNLYGGIFQWTNEGRPLVDKNNLPTNKIHGYNQDWGKWLTKGEVVYD